MASVTNDSDFYSQWADLLRAAPAASVITVTPSANPIYPPIRTFTCSVDTDISVEMVDGTTATFSLLGKVPSHSMLVRKVTANSAGVLLGWQ